MVLIGGKSLPATSCQDPLSFCEVGGGMKSKQSLKNPARFYEPSHHVQEPNETPMKNNIYSLLLTVNAEIN